MLSYSKIFVGKRNKGLSKLRYMAYGCKEITNQCTVLIPIRLSMGRASGIQFPFRTHFIRLVGDFRYKWVA